jgi:PAS domain S-box-containing protein
VDIQKLDINGFTLRAEAMYKRLAYLYQSAGALPLLPDILPQAYKELGNASEIVQIAAEELYQQNEELIRTRDLVEAERQRYQDLFEFAPDGYLVTDAHGLILEANRAAEVLFNLSKQVMVGKPIINFVTLESRQCFRSLLNQLSKSDRNKELLVSLLPRNGNSFKAALTVTSIRNQEGKPQVLRWLLRDITERSQFELLPLENDFDFIQDRPLHKHCSRETIILYPQVLWYVTEGLVKLSTLCETGEEVLVGFVKEGMVFGSSMTSLHTYQATALSDVSLVSIHLTEMAASPRLSHVLLPKINQRLRQTESFLVISGMRQLEDRLLHVLHFLKQEIGEKVPQGIRLSVRLTHEDFAIACCTTRVTITRLMGKLKKQGKIHTDSKKHIIINDW